MVDGYSRRKTIDQVDFWFVHDSQKLPGIRGEGLDITPLTLGIDGIKGETGFAGTGYTGENNQLIFGDVDGDVF